MRIGEREVRTGRRRDPTGNYVVVMGRAAWKALNVEAEATGDAYVYRAKSWREVERLLRRARALGLDVVD